MDTPANGRDGQGRFAPGSAGGPGRPRGRGYDLLVAAQEAVTPDHMRAVVRKALMMALGGNLGAMRFLAERTMGRAAEGPEERVALDITMPKLQTIDDCTKAIDQVNDAMIRGAISIEAARALIDVIAIRMKGIEVKDLEQRIVDLEKAAASVDLGGQSR